MSETRETVLHEVPYPSSAHGALFVQRLAAEIVRLHAEVARLREDAARVNDAKTVSLVAGAIRRCIQRGSWTSDDLARAAIKALDAARGREGA